MHVRADFSTTNLGFKPRSLYALVTVSSCDVCCLSNDTECSPLSVFAEAIAGKTASKTPKCQPVSSKRVGAASLLSDHTAPRVRLVIGLSEVRH